MDLISSKDSFSNLTNYYKVSGVTNVENAIRWINSVRYLSGIVVAYILLTDLADRSDEGSESIQLNHEISFEDLKNKIRERNIDLISITGTYFDKPIVLGVDLRGYYVFITIRKSNAVDVNALEVALRVI